MQELISICYDTAVESETLVSDKFKEYFFISKVFQAHCLNILRALIKDSKLSDDASLNIADCLKISIKCYNSRLWEVCFFKFITFIAYRNKLTKLLLGS